MNRTPSALGPISGLLAGLPLVSKGLARGLVLGLVLPLAAAQDPDAPTDPAQPTPDPAIEAREVAFEKQMSGCRMVGKFTVTGSDAAAREESYTISKVSWVRDNKWRFDAKIEYGGKSVTVPVVVEVEWAGDTPMIQVTEKMIPGLGTYSARVLVYGDHYAGWWGGGDHGGHMFGRIEALDGAAPAADADKDGDHADAMADARADATAQIAANAARARAQIDANAAAATAAVEQAAQKARGAVQRANAAAPSAAADRQDPAAASWPQWRGPASLAVAADASPPIAWSEDENVAWKVQVSGLGLSTPIVFGDVLYLTTAVDTGRAAEAAADDAPPAAEPPADEPRGRGRGRGGRGGRGGGRAAPINIHEFKVVALNRHTGEELWSRTVTEAVPHEAGHGDSTQASGSPITDGKRIYAYFGSRGLFCLDMQGEVLWSAQFGQMQTRNGFGEGSSPALHGDTIVVVWDHEGQSFIAALDAATGDERWREERDEITTWSTPLVVPVGDAVQVIVPGTSASRGYDLATGKEIWRCSGMTTNVIPSPLYRDGVAYLMSGFRGNAVQAIRLDGAKGDITDSDQVLWSHNRGASYVPSALLYGDFLYFLRTNNAVLTCLDPRTGEVYYEGQRMDGMRSVYSSPVGAAGRVYVTSREGVTKVLELGAEYKELASNQLDDGIDATLVIVGDTIYARGRNRLYCIRKS